MGIKKVIKKIIRPTVVYNTVVQNPTAGNLLQGKVAIVTGGSSGLGLEICKAFLAEGATVVMTGRNADKIRRSCEQLNSDRIYGYEWDVKDIRNAKQHILNALGLCKNIENPTLDIFVNNAGTLTAHDWQGDFFAVTEEDFDTVFETNMKSVFFISQAVAELMLQQKNNQIKKIINVTSETSLVGAVIPYGLSKWGVTGLTKGLGKRLASQGIIVNGVAPGIMATDMVGWEKDEILVNYQPNKRVGQPNEVAGLVSYLACDLSNHIVGQIISIDGGDCL